MVLVSSLCPRSCGVSGRLVRPVQLNCIFELFLPLIQISSAASPPQPYGARRSDNESEPERFDTLEKDTAVLDAIWWGF